MKLIALITTLFKLIGRGFDRLNAYDKQRKQMQREDRRTATQAEPDKAFADLFGQPDNVRMHKPIKTDAVNDPLRPDISTIVVDKDQQRSDKHSKRNLSDS